MKALPLKEWPDYLLEWAEPNKRVMAQPPPRRKLAIFGELPGTDGKPSRFVVGSSRDEYGTVLHLNPAQNHPPTYSEVR
jgi:hypothetical protein